MRDRTRTNEINQGAQTLPIVRMSHLVQLIQRNFPGRNIHIAKELVVKPEGTRL